MNNPFQVSLIPGEKVVTLRRQALAAPVMRSLLPLFEALAVVALFAVYLSLRGAFRSLAGGLVLVSALAVIAHASLIWLQWWALLYVVTDRRAIRRQGLIAVTQREAPLDKAQNVTTIEGGFEKLLGLGHVLIETSSMGKPVAFDRVTRAPELTELVMKQIEALRGQSARQARVAIDARLRQELGMRWPREAE